ncbi:MAG: AAA family ATPase [Anaerolineales bacterium]
MFTARSLTFLLGPLFSKKSWLALDLGVCLAAGLRWPSTSLPPSPASGRGVGGEGQPLPVLHIDESHGLSETSRRLSAIKLAHRTPPNIPFHCSSFPGYNLTHPGDILAIAQNALSLNAGLVVIDQPYGLDLGSGASLHILQPLVSSLRALAHSTNTAVLILLQTRTRSQRSALGKALSALGVDHVLSLDFYPTDMPKATPYNKLLPRYRSGYLHLRTLASVGGGQFSVFAKIHASDHAFSLTAVDRIPNLQSLKLSTFQTGLGPAGLALLRFLLAKGSANTRELMFGVTSSVPTRIRTLVHQLSREGYIHCIKPGGAGRPAVYALTSSGKSLI